MDFEYLGTYVIKGRKVGFNSNRHQLLSDFDGQTTVFVEVNITTTGKIMVNLTRFCMYEKLGTVVTVNDVLNKLTDLYIQRYKQDVVPTPDELSGAYDNRVTFTDPVVDKDVVVQYTDFNNPSRRDVIETRHLCRDIVIHSDTVSLKNTIPTVNGIVHKHIYDEQHNDMFVIGGYKNVVMNKTINMGLMNFETVGGLKSVQSINNEHIMKDIIPHGYIYLHSDVAITGSFPIISLDGYLIFGTMSHILKVVDPHTIRIDLSKLNIPAMYVHHPMTPYNTRAGYKAANETLEEKNESIDVEDMIRKFFKEYESQHSQFDNGIGQFSYSDIYYELESSVNQTMSRIIFDDPEYIRSLFVSDRSYIFLVNNDAIKLKKYSGVLQYNKAIFDSYGLDTPRGILMYNSLFAYPYRIMSNDRNVVHHLYLGKDKTTTDSYETSLDTSVVLAPRVDEIDNRQNLHVELIELYSK